MYNVQCLLSSWEVRRLGMRERIKTRKYNGLRIWIFSQKLPFSVEKKCFKDKLRKYHTLYLYVIEQLFPTLYGFRGVAGQ